MTIPTNIKFEKCVLAHLFEEKKFLSENEKLNDFLNWYPQIFNFSYMSLNSALASKHGQATFAKSRWP